MFESHNIQIKSAVWDAYLLTQTRKQHGFCKNPNFIIRFSAGGTVGIGTVGIFVNARGTVGFSGIPTVPMSVNKTMLDKN